MNFRFLLPGIICIFLLSCTPLFGQFSYVTGPSLPQTEISLRRAATVDAAGGVWVGFRQSIGYYNGSNWRIYTDTSGIPFSRLKKVEAATGSVWFASADSGVAVLNNTIWTGYNTQNSALVNDTVRDISVDGNTVWIATANGLSSFNGSVWNTYTTSNSAMLSNDLLDVSAENGIVWMVAAGGVCRFETATQIWTAFPLSVLPPVGNLTAILVSGNDVWLGGSDGAAYWNNGSFRSVSEITDGIDFPVLSIEKGAQGMPLFLSGPSPRFGVQLRMNAVPHRISVSPLSSFLGAVSLTYSSQTNNYIYVGQASDMSPNPGYQVFGTGDTDPGISALSNYSSSRHSNLNNVDAVFHTRGDFGWDLLSSASFEVPKGGGTNTLFSSGLWVGGYDVGGQLHQAAMTYRQTGIDYFPGPLDTVNATTDSATASQYNYIWKINRTDIEAFIYHFAQGNVQNGSFTPAGDILSWPAQGTGNFSRSLAPFFDANSNGIYDPLTGGDYPVIKGDQMLYWIFNDNLAPHTETGGLPLGLEVHASVWSYACPALPDSQQVLNTTVFYSYELINRSATAYSQTRAGLFQDYDLGSFSDDFVGSAPADNVCFVYNGLANDGAGPPAVPSTYGANPPVFGLTVLDGPPGDLLDGIDNDNDGQIDEPGEKNLLSHFQYYSNDFTVTGNPTTALHFYNYLNSHWTDGTPVTFGGNGYGGVTPASFMFSGAPFDTAQWSEPTAGNVPSDRRGVASTNMEDFTPGESITLTYAQVWSRDTTAVHGTPGYINFFLNDVRRVQNWYATNSFPSCVNWTVSTSSENTAPEAKLYPNPGSELVTLDYLPQTRHAQLQIIDLTGRVVQEEQLTAQPLNVFNAAALQPGVYLLRVTDGAQVIVFRFVRR
ncbi:MAG: T9SS type A sorting domain-containing protein [Bacteroidia bacterium]|jgi:hypothetical protein|nr:T9SS type A sorting domain-containing protein [Bacteroidia bacterium]